MTEPVPNTLASYVPWRREVDDDYQLRIVLHAPRLDCGQ